MTHPHPFSPHRKRGTCSPEACLGDVGGDVLALILHFLASKNPGSDQVKAFCALRSSCRTLRRIAANVPMPVTLSAKRMGASSAISAITFLQTAAQFHTVEMKGVLDAGSVPAFVAYLSEKAACLTSLDLSAGRFGSGVPELAGAVSCSYLTLLALDECRVDAGDAESLAHSLCGHSCLTALHLRGNRIDNEGAASLAKMLKHNNVLTLLDVAFNGIGEVGAGHFREGLACNTALKALQFSGNCIKQNGYCALLLGVAEGGALESLYLTGCGVSLGMGRDSSPLKGVSLTSLKSLNLSENGPQVDLLGATLSPDCNLSLGSICGTFPTWTGGDKELQEQLEKGNSFLY